MGIIGTIFIGLIVGLLARFLKPGDDSMGWIMTILLGIAGSLVATYGGQALGIYQAGQGAGFIGALIGAIVLLVIYGLIKRNDLSDKALCAAQAQRARMLATCTCRASSCAVFC